MKTLITILMMVSTMAMGEQSNSNVSAGSSANNLSCGTVHVHCKSTVVYATQKQIEKIKELETQIALLTVENEKLKGMRVHDLAAYKHVIINIDNRVAELRKSDKGNNAFSIVGGASQTGLSASQTALTTYVAKTVYEADFGLRYEHDFSYIRGSIEGTLNGTILLGAGIRF